jgi:hypothetical protein
MSKMPDISIEKVGPAKAKAFLDKNERNRPLNDKLVDLYAYDMKQGKWVFNNDAICFNSQGALSNGQHRLNAIIRSGQTCEFVVIRKMEDDAFKYMDTQKKRTAADVLAIEGVSEANRIAAIANFVMNFERNSFSNALTQSRKGKGMSNADISNFVHRHKTKLLESIPYGYNKGNRSLIPPSTLSGLYFLFAKKDENLADKFCHQLIVGTELSSDNPIYLLRQKLIANIRSIKKMAKIHRLALICKAWNFYVTGKKVTHFGWNSMSEPFPKPILS